MKNKRKIIEINEDLCNGCGQCATACAEGALEIVDGKAKLVSEMYCDGLGACLGECPTGALKVTEKEAEEFDEKAVEHHLHKQSAAVEGPTPVTLPCGCPSTQLRTFAPSQGCQEANRPASQELETSALGHWPVQIRLVPATAPFLKNADLLVAADCTPIAYPAFHKDFLQGRTILVGCPKFDDVQAYIEKFAEIFARASIKSVTVVVMEVPCCGGLPQIVKRGMQLAGKTLPVEQIVVSIRGEILSKKKLVA